MLIGNQSLFDPDRESVHVLIMSIVEQRWKEFETVGEEKVRQNLALQIYGEDNKKLALAWLEHKKNQQSSSDSARTLAIMEEQLRAAKFANIAAWIAAI